MRSRPLGRSVLAVVGLLLAACSGDDAGGAQGADSDDAERTAPIEAEGPAYVLPAGPEFRLVADGAVRQAPMGALPAVTVYADLDLADPFAGPLLAVEVNRIEYDPGASSHGPPSESRLDEGDDLRVDTSLSDDEPGQELKRNVTVTKVVGRRLEEDAFEDAVDAARPDARPPMIDSRGLPAGLEPVATGRPWQIFGARSMVSGTCTTELAPWLLVSAVRGADQLVALVAPYLRVTTPTASIRGRPAWRSAPVAGWDGQAVRVVAWAEEGVVYVAHAPLDTPGDVMTRALENLRLVDETEWSAAPTPPLCDEQIARLGGESGGGRWDAELSVHQDNFSITARGADFATWYDTNRLEAGPGEVELWPVRMTAARGIAVIGYGVVPDTAARVVLDVGEATFDAVLADKGPTDGTRWYAVAATVADEVASGDITAIAFDPAGEELGRAVRNP